MTFDELMVETGRKLGIELVTHDGMTQLTVDDMDVSILELVELESIVLSGVIGEPPPQGLEPLYRAMLEANYSFAGTAGATLAVNPENGVLTLTRLVPSVRLDADALVSVLEGFVNVLEMWRKIVADYRPNVADASSTSSPNDMTKGDGWMLQV